MTYSSKTRDILHKLDALITNGTVQAIADFDALLAQLDDPELVKRIEAAVTRKPGWIFCGADFNALEDRVGALLTKDPNRLKEYEQGFDGHCLRAGYYFQDQMQGIDLDSVDSVNSIKKKYPKLRQQSKGPSFALQYFGNWKTLHRRSGFPKPQAKQIEQRYHQMYKVSSQWANARLDQAHTDGYVRGAFGLRIRTPVLKQTLSTKKVMPYEAQAERRSAGNAMTQSYGMLTNRAAIEFYQRCNQGQHRGLVLQVAHIHDAIYMLMQDELQVAEWVNHNLVDCMSWQVAPELQHPVVKLGAELDIYYPTWADDLTLPNGVDATQIADLCTKHIS